MDPKNFEDLNSLITPNGVWCLNEDSTHTHKNLFMGDDRLFLKSDADEQLIIHVPFNEKVRLHSLSLVAPQDDSAPLTLKLYINRPNLSFDEAQDMEPTQTIQLSADELTPDSFTVLRFVKFQSVTSVTLFIEDNNGAECTVISGLHLFGTPIQGTNVGDIKDVSKHEH